MSLNPSFNQIPGSGLAAPIFAFEVNSGGQYETTTRMHLFGYKTAAGILASNTPTPVASQADADLLAGPGSMLREMFRVAVANAPAQPIWLTAIDDPGTAKAAWALTLGTPVAGQGTLEICGLPLAFAVNSGDSATTVAANIAATINAFYDSLTGAMLPVTAAAATNVVTLTARHAGIVMNDVDIYSPPVPSNAFSGAGILTIAQSVSGTGTPSLSAALAALGDDKADFVVAPFGDSTTISAIAATFGDASGRWSWSRQTYGAYWFPVSGNYAARITAGLALPNTRQMVPVGRPAASPTPSWVWIAERCAVEAPWLSDITTGNVSRNQTGRATLFSRPPRDRSLWDNFTARNQLILAGVSTYRVGPSGNVAVDKTVTAYKVNAAGNPDTVFRDVQSIYQVGLGLPYIRAVLHQEHGNKALADSNPGSLDAISTCSDIKATLIHAYETLCAQGVFENADFFAGHVVVKRNAQNPARADSYCPMDRVNPMDILACNATIYAQFPPL